MNDPEAGIAPSTGFLSRVTCSTRLDQAWQLRTPYEQHRTLWRLFAGHDARDFLFREQVAARRLTGTPRQFIIVSTQRPHTAPGFTLETREYAPQLKVGDVLGFSAKLSVTAAQPVERPKSPGAPLRGRGKTIDPIADALAAASGMDERRALRRRWLVGESADEGTARMPPLLISRWLAPRLQRHGLEVIPAATRVASYEPAMHQGRKAKDSITFSVADFSGVVRVTDSALATAVAFSGLGRGKALGYGMLLFARRAVGAELLHTGAADEDDASEELPA